MDQNTAEWFELRRLCITASRTLDIIKMSKGYAAAKRKEIAGKESKDISVASLRWGRDNEKKAAALYELKNDVDAEECGFQISVIYPYFGASCDRSIHNNGLIEIKCPYLPSNFEALCFSIPDEYQAQIQGQLFVTGREWCDFVVFDPRRPITDQIYIKRVFPSKVWFERINNAVPYFWENYILKKKEEQEIPKLF